jgi:hypothetical protein
MPTVKQIPMAKSTETRTQMRWRWGSPMLMVTD